MRCRASFTVALLALIAGSQFIGPRAIAQPSEGPPALGSEAPGPAEPGPPEQMQPGPPGGAHDAQRRRGPAPSPVETKGPRGMMGNPWPKTADEAQKTIANLMAHLATTDDALLAGEIAVSIEKLWRLPGGDTVNLLIDRGALFASKNELEKALKLLDAATELAPDYAEVWNRRAYVFYRMENTNAALGDLRRALALEPNHFRALDGMAKILESAGEKKAALKAYDQLLKIYPEIEGATESADKLRKEVEGRGI